MSAQAAAAPQDVAPLVELVKLLAQIDARNRSQGGPLKMVTNERGFFLLPVIAAGLMLYTFVLLGIQDTHHHGGQTRRPERLEEVR